jgi:ATP/maltotriose-dependent transcriptional regulator MalT
VSGVSGGDLWSSARRRPYHPSVPDGWPLTGRTEELRLVGESRQRGHGALGVVLAGAAGVGKTRLAREALAAARDRGAATRWAVATAAGRTLPLGAFAALVGNPSSDPTQLLRRAADTLTGGADRAGVVIGVDDGHLLDDLSASLVHHLVVRRAATVVLTLRTGEPTPDAVTALWKDGHLQRLELQPLSETETAQLLEAALGGPVESATARRLWSITGGNPLYLRQLVDGEREADRIGRTAGVWRWVGEPRLSLGLSELVSERIGALSDAEREVVDVLAFGEPLGVALLRRLTDPAAVEQAEARGVVQVSSDGRRWQARLAHPLYGEVQRARCGRVRARRLRGRIAAAIADTGARREEDVLRRAVLAVDSDLSPDPEALTAAAHRAAALVDLRLAERLARAAVAAGAGFEAGLVAAYTVTWLGRGEEAERMLAALTASVRTDEQRTRVVVPRAANMFWALGRVEEADEVLLAADAVIVDRAARTELEAVRCAIFVQLGRTTEAATAAERVLASPHATDRAVTWAALAGCVAMGLAGRCDGLGRVATRGWQSGARSFETSYLRFGLCDAEITALRLAGRLDDADARAAALVVRGQDDAPPAGPLRRLMQAAVALDRGRLAAARRQLGDVLVGLAVTGSGGGGAAYAVRCAAALAQACGMAGDAAQARDRLARLPPPPPSAAYLGADGQLARAWAAAADGASTAAVRSARRAAELAARTGQLAVEVVALHTAVQLGDRTVADRLAELAGLVDGPRVQAAAAHAGALAADDGAGLLAASSVLEAMGALLLAADAAAQAAAAHTRRGMRSGAHAAAARAQRLAQDCDGARTPALRAVALPPPLTAREREIAALAASGRSNREIAERLVVSVRTVEGHLYRVCRKLGVADRTGLAAILSEGAGTR